MQTDRITTLTLDDDIVSCGYSSGYERPVADEVVFNTATTGYPGSLADPPYAGQLMALTYPLVGNYGVPPHASEPNGVTTSIEGEKAHAGAIIVSDYSHEYSHRNAECSLGDWLKEEKIPSIYGIDMCASTRKLREHGVMMRRIVISDAGNEIGNGESEIGSYEHVNCVDRVSCKEVICYLLDDTSQIYSLSEASSFRFSILNSQFLKRIVLLGCGAKHNTVCCPLRRNMAAARVFWDYGSNRLEYDSLFISSGLGGPDICDTVVWNIRKALSGDKSICGICIGNQLSTKVGDASTYKLEYSRRSHSRPVRMVDTEECFVTSQDHGYAVGNDMLGEEWEPLFINMDDGTSEGIKRKMKPFFSSQFHPETYSGLLDTESISDEFTELLQPGIYAHPKRRIRVTPNECSGLSQAGVQTYPRREH